ncbi:DUF1846 family protein [bacterium]|nr:DUF1846 family protein [bacterium]
MNTTDLVTHEQIGFDNKKYLTLQKEAISERMSRFSGKLYLEIGGKFLYDPHGERVLPGFDPYIKPKIIKSLNVPFEIIFCVNAKDIASNRMLTNENVSYIESTIKIIEEYKETFNVSVSIAINMVAQPTKELTNYRQDLEQKGYKTYLRYVIGGYPNPEKVVSEMGYGKDDYISTNTKLILVTGPASNSGKMSTCLGQIYHDQKRGKDSGYAKYELFPIWNLELNHPVNRAYEAATADIGDYNLYDYHHKNAYGLDAVNYNRDVEAFPIITGLLKKMIPQSNFMHNYHSPTDMGMNKAGFAISDNTVVARAGYEEILRRKKWFQEQFDAGRGEQAWVNRCEEKRKEAAHYLKTINN